VAPALVILADSIVIDIQGINEDLTRAAATATTTAAATAAAAVATTATTAAVTAATASIGAIATATAATASIGAIATATAPVGANATATVQHTDHCFCSFSFVVI
jgi:hypothetical protein